MRWWVPPKQRQRWGASHILPRRGKWTSIFFDLFYVAGCINLGNILKEAAAALESGSSTPFWKFLLYFCGTGFPVMTLWFEKLSYDARFTLSSKSSKKSKQETKQETTKDRHNNATCTTLTTTTNNTNTYLLTLAKYHGAEGGYVLSEGNGDTLIYNHPKDPKHEREREHEHQHHEEDDDVFHRWLDVLQICAVATALSRIRSPEVMSDICRHNDIFQFSFSIFVSYAVNMYRYLEVMLFVVDCDLPAAKVAARRDLEKAAIPCLIFLLVAINTGYAFYCEYGQYYRRRQDGSDYYAEDGEEEFCQDAAEDHKPILACLAGWASQLIANYYYDVLAYGTKNNRNTDPTVVTKHHRMMEMSVPRNIHFCIHRYGEWFMLMFGESIISLLIVDGHNEASEYKLAFYSGIVSVVVLAHWHYGREPHNPDEHALSRSRHSSFFYTALLPIYSALLIAVGVSYKLFLYEYTYRSEEHRRLNENQGGDHGGDQGGDQGQNANANYDYGNYAAQQQSQSYYNQSSSQEHSSYSEGITNSNQFAANLFSVSITFVLVMMDVIAILHKGIPEVYRMANSVRRRNVVLFVAVKYTLVLVLATFSVHHDEPHVMAVCCMFSVLLLELLQKFFSHHLHRHYLCGPPASSTTESQGSSDSQSDDDDDSVWFRSHSSSVTEVMNTPKGARRRIASSLAVFERQMLVEDGFWPEDELRGGYDAGYRGQDPVGEPTGSSVEIVARARPEGLQPVLTVTRDATRHEHAQETWEAVPPAACSPGHRLD